MTTCPRSQSYYVKGLVSNSGLLMQRLISFTRANVTTSEGSGIKKKDSISLLANGQRGWLWRLPTGTGKKSRSAKDSGQLCGSPWSLKTQNEKKI